MPAETPEPQIVLIERAARHYVCYAMSDGLESGFRVEPAMADFIVEAWAARRSSHVSLAAILKETQELTEIVKGMA